MVTPARTWPFELPVGRSTVVGRGRLASLDLAHPSVNERHCALSVRESHGGEHASVVLEVLRGAGEVQVNDVPISGSTTLRPGDEVRLGEARLLLQFVPPAVEPRASPLPFDDFLGRLTDEVARARGRPLAVCAVSLPPLNVAARQAVVRRVMDEVARQDLVAWWGALASDLLVCCVPDAKDEQIFTRLPGLAPRAKVVSRTSNQGVEALLAGLWRQLLGEELEAGDPIVVDPAMVRLFDLMESLVDSPRSVLVVGSPGSGRRTLLRALGEPAAISPEVTSLPAAVGGRVLATSSVPLEGFDVVVQVPPLRARRAEIPVMAEAFLARARTLLGRPRLHLAPDALALIEQWWWPGNVRELKNVMLRAARASVRDEVSRDSLPAALAHVSPTADLRDAMRLAERELLLEALGRTRWNVTATAQRLGMARRTVVYRMAKLGLKRPAR